MTLEDLDEIDLDGFEGDVCLDDLVFAPRAHSGKRPQGLARKVPAKVRRELPRNPLLAQRVLAEMVEKATATTGNPSDTAIRRHISSQWETPEYRFWVHSRIEHELTAAHLARREKDRAVPEIDPRSPPREGPWKAEGNLSLGFDPVLESLPDELAVSFASMIVGVSMHERTQALVLGAASSSVGLAVDGIERGLGRSASRVQILEVDAFDWPRGSRCLHGPRLRWDQDLAISLPRNDDEAVLKMVPPRLVRPNLDVVILTPPSPAIGSAAQARNKYLFDGSEESRTACDPGRSGVRKWSLTVGAALSRAVERLSPGGTVVGLIPLGVRTTFQAATGQYRPGLAYVETEETWAALVPIMQDLGLELERTIGVTEVNPKRVPFVADRRPPYRFFVARREAP